MAEPATMNMETAATSARASEEDLAELHNLVTRKLRTIIECGVPLVNSKGEPVRDDLTGEMVFVPAPPTYYANAVKLLKDNNITCVVTPGSPLQELLDAIPDMDTEDLAE